MEDITLTPHQEAAITFIVDAVNAGKRLLAIRGLAGTGKSALIPHLRRALEDARQCTVDIGAPTHRAAMVLRMKGIHNADTVHGLALVPRFAYPYREALSMLGDPATLMVPRYDDQGLDDEEHGTALRVPYDDESPDTLLGAARAEWILTQPFPDKEQLLLRAKTYGAAKALRSIGIHARNYIDGYRPKAGTGSILILDEASMVGRELLELCQQAYRTIILVGDPGQLPPVNDVAILQSVEGFSLNEVHRQTEGSQILRLAYDVRGGTMRWHGNAMQRYSPDVLSAENAPAQRLLTAPVLVWRNATRMQLTRAIRAALGYSERMVAPGEPLVCRATTKEDRQDGFYNNVLFRIVDVEAASPRLLLIAPEHAPDEVQLVTAHMEELDGGYIEPGSVLFRFGYALTVHTAQGGEWPLVVIDMQDLLAQRDMAYARKELDMAAQWGYTAVTRAKERLVLLYARVFTS